MFSSRSTKDRILSAASTVIIRNGTAVARVQEIAEHAGVSTAALHYHFGSKEELADRVLEVVVVRLIGRFLNAWSPGDTLAANVQRAVQVCMNEFAEDSRMVGYILAETHRNPDRFEPVRRRLPASISYRSHELLRHLGARNQASTDTNLCARPEEFLIDRAQEKMADVDAKIRDLRQIRRVLGQLVETCEAHGAPEECALMHASVPTETSEVCSDRAAKLITRSAESK